MHGWAGENGKLNLHLNPARVAIYWKGLGVAVVRKNAKKTLWQFKDCIASVCPVVLVLSIGSNDLSRACPDLTCNRIMEFIDYCVNEIKVEHIVLLELLSRLYDGALFNQNVLDTNQALKEAITSRNDVHFWEHTRQNFSGRLLDTFVSDDGTHMNPQGLIKFYVSVRGAVLVAEKTVSGKQSNSDPEN